MLLLLPFFAGDGVAEVFFAAYKECLAGDTFSLLPKSAIVKDAVMLNAAYH